MPFDMTPEGLEAAKRRGDWGAVMQITGYLKFAEQAREKNEKIDLDGDGRIADGRRAPNSAFVGNDEYGGAMSYDADGNWQYKDKFGGTYDQYGYTRGNTFYGNGGITHEKGSDTIKVNGEKVDIGFKVDRPEDVDVGAKLASLYMAHGKGDLDRGAANAKVAGGLSAKPPASQEVIQASTMAGIHARSSGIDINTLSKEEKIERVDDQLIILDIRKHEMNRVQEALKKNPHDKEALARRNEIQAMSKLKGEDFVKANEAFAQKALQEYFKGATPAQRHALTEALNKHDHVAATRALKDIIPEPITADNAVLDSAIRNTTISPKPLNPLPKADAAASSFVSVASHKALETDARTLIKDRGSRLLLKEEETKRLAAELRRHPESKELQERMQELKDMDKLPPGQFEKALVRLSNRLAQERWDALPQADKEALDKGLSSMDPKTYAAAVRQMFAKETPAEDVAPANRKPAPKAPGSGMKS